MKINKVQPAVASTDEVGPHASPTRLKSNDADDPTAEFQEEEVEKSNPTLRRKSTAFGKLVIRRRSSVKSGAFGPKPRFDQWYFLHRKHPLRKLSDGFLVIIILYTAFAMPYRIAFGDDLDPMWISFDVVIAAMSVYESVIYFLSFYRVDDKDDIRGHTMSARFKQYAELHLWTDLISLLPYIIVPLLAKAGYWPFEVGRTVNVAAIRMLRTLSLAKIVKILTLNRYLHKFEDKLKNRIVLLIFIKNVAAILCMAHLVACIFTYFALYGDTTETWVTYYDPAVLNDRTSLYVTSLYFAFSTLASIGLGDVVPITDHERLATFLVFMAGVTFYSFTISNASATFSVVVSKEELSSRQNKDLNNLIKRYNIKRSLSKKLKRYFNMSIKKNAYANSQKEIIMTRLPDKLRVEVNFFIHKDLIDQIPFLMGKDPKFVSTFISVIQPLHTKARDYLAFENEPSDEICFILEGQVKASQIKGNYTKTLGPGDYFGERSVIGGLHDYTIRSVTETRIQFISRINLRRFAIEDPQFIFALKHAIPQLTESHSCSNVNLPSTEFSSQSQAPLFQVHPSEKILKSSLATEIENNIKLAMVSGDALSVSQSNPGHVRQSSSLRLGASEEVFLQTNPKTTPPTNTRRFSFSSETSDRDPNQPRSSSPTDFEKLQYLFQQQRILLEKQQRTREQIEKLRRDLQKVQSFETHNSHHMN